MPAEFLSVNGWGQTKSLAGVGGGRFLAGRVHALTAEDAENSQRSHRKLIFRISRHSKLCHTWATRIIGAESKIVLEAIMRIPFLLGRLLFGGYFISAGINHFKQTPQLAQYAASKNVPKPDVAVKVTGAALIAGGASILLGIKPKVGTAAIIGFLAGVSPVMHDFWRQEQPEQRMNDMINFTKNVALAGGAMALMGVEEPWPASVPVEKRKPMQRVKRWLQDVAA
jgi:putative oxidoreductase